MKHYLILCSDLFFASKVGGTADMLGLEAETVMSPDKALEQIKANPELKGLILDLTVPGLNLQEFLDQVPCKLLDKTIAFGPHVETEKLALASEKGCAQVLPRSRFSNELPELLRLHYLSEIPE